MSTHDSTPDTADAAAEYLLGDAIRPRPRARKTQRQVERATRKQEALTMRLAGVRIDRIAQLMGVHRRTVSLWIADAIRDIPREEADELRLLESTRLDALQQAVWTDAMRGEPRAVDRVLAIMDRRARYFGLYDSRTDGIEAVGNLLDRLIGEG